MGINSAFKGLNRLTITRKFCSYFWVIPLRRNFYTPTFRDTLFHLHRRCKHEAAYTAQEDATEYFETSACRIQTPANHPQERIQHSEHGETLKLSITEIFPMCEQHEQFVVLWKTHWTRNARIARSDGAVFNDVIGKGFLLIQIGHQPDATIFHFIILTFIYSSTCFERSPGPPRQRTQHGFHHDTMVKPEAATAFELLLMGGRTTDTC
jgi:hypothetical protein